jgi:peptidoglycan/LPS O-acetylase OafA/YrhL
MPSRNERVSLDPVAAEPASMTNRVVPSSPGQGPPANPNYRADIDGLRAVAVLSVVGFHAFPSWVRGGFIGVDVFFVISGFLISSIIFGGLARNGFSFVDFYSRRIRRIFPALILVLIACYVVGWLVLLPEDYKQLGRQIAGGAGFASNFLLWQESGYFDTAAATKPLLHLWSLGIEEQFYIVWPAFLWCAWKYRINLAAVAFAIAVASFALNVAVVDSDAVAAFYSPQTRFWELMAGSLLAYGTLFKPASPASLAQRLNGWVGARVFARAPEKFVNVSRDLRSALGAALIVASVILITRDTNFPGWWGALPVLGAALIISAGGKSWFNRAILSNRFLVWVGLISYPIYLWHWPLLSFARIVEGETPSPEVRLAAVAASIVLAALTYLLIEKRVRFGDHAKEKTVGLIVLMSVIGVIGYLSYKGDGLTFRLPKMVQELTSSSYDYKSVIRTGTCFLLPEQDYTAFASCEATGKPGNPVIVLWGDSYAAQYYPGYKAEFGESYNLVQRTASWCPPILDMEINGRPNCRKINDFVFASMQSQKPAKVVLSARWEIYQWKKVETTISRLRQLGITDIDLIGPVPRWKDKLPATLYRYFVSDPLHRIPERMNYGLYQEVLDVDPVMSAYAKGLGVNYLSPIKILCNGSGCITRLGNTGDTLIAWDYAHLTEIGSRFVVSRFPRN